SCEAHAPSVLVVRMHPPAMIEHDPELVLLERAQIGDDCHQDMLDAFVQEGERQVMVIDDVVTIFGAEDHRDHVIAEKSADLSRAALSNHFALVFDFAHADRNLRWPQALNGDWRENRIAYESHDTVS